MEFASVRVLRAFPIRLPVSVPIEIAVNELAEKYRLVKGGTIRSEATKDKVRTLAPAVYANEVKMTVP